MSGMIRCPNCRGMKQVAKLGGMMGDCNLCKGTGQATVDDRPKFDVDVVTAQDINNIKLRVANATAEKKEEVKAVEATPFYPTEEKKIEVETVKIAKDGKRAIYKRKKE